MNYNVLSLGAGVQSSAMALMAMHGEITPKPDFAIFSDTQAEPDSIYKWVDYLESKLDYPLIRVTAGNLTDATLSPAYRTKDTAGGKKGSSYMPKLIPMFGKSPTGEKQASLGRACTKDFKINPIFKEIKRYYGVKPRSQKQAITQWVGISYDEIQRMREDPKPWLKNRYPLIELNMHRWHCKEWMKKNGYPEPPRSACYYCPFHSDDEWRHLRNNDPKFFKKAIEYDKALREKFKEHDSHFKMEVYLHRSCEPLGEINFDNEIDKGQLDFDFQSECQGMCGV